MSENETTTKNEAPLFAVEMKPRFPADVTLSAVLAGWVKRAQDAPVREPRGHKPHRLIVIPEAEYGALCTLFEESSVEQLGDQLHHALMDAKFDCKAKAAKAAPRKRRTKAEREAAAKAAEVKKAAEAPKT